MRDEDPAEHWEQRYRENSRAWSGRANPTLVSVIADLTPGTALDLACGEGADVLWLAAHGWNVTGVDISPTAIQRAHEAAANLEGAAFVAADLSQWVPEAPVDLVCSSFLHSTVALPRIEILRSAASWVKPGGHLFVLTHAEAPWWSGLAHEHHVQLQAPEVDLESLALDGELWETVEVGVREREAVSPDGEPGMLRDGVILLRRA